MNEQELAVIRTFVARVNERVAEAQPTGFDAEELYPATMEAVLGEWEQPEGPPPVE